ncbi:hypothetical protein BURCENBC7_AP6073 [Burkholderia cenocepacia BC7]|nr:hypothetical protein BURCENK562V_C6167 [Burkholderia cenocepacia K56-2Valvano]ERI30605.1 hypothetical protein BURCENBC7_AP6073 [Burkholderia cenocepacia BC7]
MTHATLVSRQARHKRQTVGAVGRRAVDCIGGCCGAGRNRRPCRIGVECAGRRNATMSGVAMRRGGMRERMRKQW